MDCGCHPYWLLVRHPHRKHASSSRPCFFNKLGIKLRDVFHGYLVLGFWPVHCQNQDGTSVCADFAVRVGRTAGVVNQTGAVRLT